MFQKFKSDKISHNLAINNKLWMTGKIMEDLHNDHATIAQKDYVEETLEYYSHFWTDPSMYYEFLTLNKESVRDRYGVDGVQSNKADRKKIRRRSLYTENSQLTFTVKI